MDKNKLTQSEKLSIFFMKTAINLGEVSNCVSKKVGAIIVKDNRIISIGYNGTPSKVKNCCEIFNEENFDKIDHYNWSKKSEIHAEMNAIIFAARKGIKIENSIMYVSYEPCEDCIKNICNSGIKVIYYYEKYDNKKPYSAEINEYIKKI